MTMSVYALSSDPEMAWVFARTFPLLRAGDRNGLAQRMRPFFNANFRDFIFPPSNDNTGHYLCFDNSAAVLICDGIQNSTQAAGIANGYRQTNGLLSFDGLNPWFVNAARNVFGQVLGVQLQFGFNRLWIVGYSAGGAIGTWTLKNCVEQFGGGFGQLTTYGAPRAMNPTDRAPIDNSNITRWMVDADPIPLIPPRAEDAPLLFLTFNLQQAITYGTYVHTRGGISINAAGQPLESILPPIAEMDVVGNLASWFLGVEEDPSNPHWIGNYEDRLEILARQLADAASVAGGGADDEPTANMPRRELTRAQQQTMSQVAHAASEQNVNAVAVDSAALFKAVRFGRIWSVEFGGQLFTFSGNKRRARHLARVGNEFLRSMPKQAVVDVGSLLSQLNAFFEAAVLPGGPVNPPINVGL